VVRCYVYEALSLVLSSVLLGAVIGAATTTPSISLSLGADTG
jgi:hypothetical protein